MADSTPPPRPAIPFWRQKATADPFRSHEIVAIPSFSSKHQIRAVLGAADFGTTFTSPRVRFTVRDGRPEKVPQDQWRILPSEEQLDAVIYLGHASDASATAMDIPRALCADPASMAMRLARIELLGPPAKAEADQLNLAATQKRTTSACQKCPTL